LAQQKTYLNHLPSCTNPFHVRDKGVLRHLCITGQEN
jgi:hypothetical protein